MPRGRGGPGVCRPGVGGNGADALGPRYHRGMLLLLALACAPPDLPTPDLPVAGKADTGAPWSPCPVAPCRVMPLGDSITDGYNVPGGYRILLEDLAVADGHAIDFVGAQSNGPSDLADHDHEGHSGWRTDQIQRILSPRLAAYTPDVVPLHIGTNDIGQNYRIGSAPTRVGRIVDTITAANPDALVIVADIIPIDSATYDARIVRFNAALDAQIASRQAAGAHVLGVDMHAVVGTADLADGVHPTSTGYDLMAEAWYDVLEPYLP